jgi:hypothetical protein
MPFTSTGSVSPTYTKCVTATLSPSGIPTTQPFTRTSSVTQSYSKCVTASLSQTYSRSVSVSPTKK